MKLRIGLDIDDTICDFIGPYLKRFNSPVEDSEITKNVSRVLIHDREFWMSLPVINIPNFTPELYCTKRIHSKEWSKEYLVNNNIPVAPIYQVYCQNTPKSSRIKGRVDVFIDDSISNFIELNKSGVPCLLIDSPRNRSWGPIGRIYSLNKDEIEDCYELFMHTIFHNFNNLIDDYSK